MKRLKLLLGVLLVLLPGTLTHAAETHAGFEAVCRISNTNSKGTGTVFAEVGGDYHILTNYHVVARANEVGVEFWRDGHLSRSVRGTVIWTSFLNGANRDMAVVSVPTSVFGNGPKPNIIPLAARGTRIPAGGTVTSVGCASGAWATAFEGHVIQSRGPVYDFRPPPAGGRSGSALYTKDGRAIVGLIAWRAAGDTHGIAMTLEEIYRAFEGKGPVDVTIASSVREIPLSYDFVSADGLVPVYQDVPTVVYEVPVCGGSGGGGGMPSGGMMPFVEMQPTYVWDGQRWVQCGPGGCQPGGGGGLSPFNGRMNPFDGRVSPFGQQPGQPGPSRGNPYNGGGGTFPTYPGSGDDSGGDTSPPSIPAAVTQSEFDGLADRVSKIEGTMLTKSQFDAAMTSLKKTIPEPVDLTGVDIRLAGIEASLSTQRRTAQELTTQLVEVDSRVTETAVTTSEAVTELKNEQQTVFGDVKLAISHFAKEYKGAREGGAEAGRDAGTEAAKSLLLTALGYTGVFAGLPLGGAGLIWLGTKLVARRRRRRDDPDENFR